MKTKATKSILDRLKEVKLPEPVEVPGTALGEGIYVRGLTGADYDAAVKKMKAGHEGGDEFTVSRVLFVTCMICEADGTLALDPGNPEHVALIGNLDNKSLQALFDKAAELNGVGSRPTSSDQPTPSGVASNSV